MIRSSTWPLIVFMEPNLASSREVKAYVERESKASIWLLIIKPHHSELALLEDDPMIDKTNTLRYRSNLLIVLPRVRYGVTEGFERRRKSRSIAVASDRNHEEGVLLWSGSR